MRDFVISTLRQLEQVRDLNLYPRESSLQWNPKIHTGYLAVVVLFVFPLQVWALEELLSFACSGWAVLSPSPEKDSSVINYRQSLSKDRKWIRISMIKNEFLFFLYCTANKDHHWFTCLAACLITIKSHQQSWNGNFEPLESLSRQILYGKSNERLGDTETSVSH